MKLSEITGPRSMEVVADLIEPVASIAADETCSDLFKRKAIPAGETAYSFTVKRLRDALPALIRIHSNDLIRILALLEDVPADEYAETMNVPKIIKGVVDVLSDEELASLFT